MGDLRKLTCDVRKGSEGWYYRALVEDKIGEHKRLKGGEKGWSKAKAWHELFSDLARVIK